MKTVFSGMSNFSTVETCWGQFTVSNSVTHVSTSNTCQMFSLDTIKAFSSYFRFNNAITSATASKLSLTCGRQMTY